MAKRRSGSRGSSKYERSQSSLTSSDEDYDDDDKDHDDGDDEDMEFYYCGGPAYGMPQVCNVLFYISLSQV